MIQQVDLAFRALLDDELLPSDAPRFLYQDLGRTREGYAHNPTASGLARLDDDHGGGVFFALFA